MYLKISKLTIIFFRWLHFSRLPFLPEIDVLKEDLAVITETYKHLHTKEREHGKDYVEAYKYTFSRKGIINITNISNREIYRDNEEIRHFKFYSSPKYFR